MALEISASPATPLQAGTLAAFLEERLGTARERAFCERMGGEAWRELSSTAMLARVKSIAASLAAAGLARGDRVAVVGDNAVDWMAVAFGTFFAGATLVPVFKTLADDQLGFILADSEARVAFVENDAVAARVAVARPDTTIVVFGQTSARRSLDDFMAHASEAAERVAVEARAATMPSDLAVLIYTSGTTGQPKGVMLSHGSLLSNAISTESSLFDPGANVSPTLHVLPFAHIMAMTGVLIGLVNGAEQYVTRPEFLMADLRDVRPRTLALVPRLLEKVLGAFVMLAARIGAVTELHAPPFETALRFAAADLAGTVSPELRAEHALAERIVFAPIRAMLGFDRIELLGTGSAALHADVAMTYYGMGLAISEGYGMTEAGPTVTISPRGAIRFGSVGRVIDGARIRTAADGEIEVSSPGLMTGYYHREGEVPFTADGWYTTGDVGRIDADGYLWLTDRKKEIFKTTTGKFVAPSRVEASIQRSVFIEQATVVGDGRAFPIALVSPSWPIVRATLEIPAGVTQAEAARDAGVLALMEREVAAMTADLAAFERVRYAGVLERDLSIEHGELSPSLKTKRRVVETSYAPVIAAVYERAAPDRPCTD